MAPMKRVLKKAVSPIGKAGKTIAHGFRIATGRQLSGRAMDETYHSGGTRFRGNPNGRATKIVMGAQKDGAGKVIPGSRMYARTHYRAGRPVRTDLFNAYGKRMKKNASKGDL